MQFGEQAESLFLSEGEQQQKKVSSFTREDFFRFLAADRICLLEVAVQCGPQCEGPGLHLLETLLHFHQPQLHLHTPLLSFPTGLLNLLQPNFQ